MFAIQDCKLIVNMNAPFINPGEFVLMNCHDPRELVKRWFDFTHYGQGKHLLEDDRIWLEELIRRARTLLRTREPKERIYEIICSSALEDREWTWLQAKEEMTDPRILGRERNETISPCGWDCCPEHLNIVHRNGVVASGCSFLGKKYLKRKPYHYAKHYRYSERIATKALEQYTTWGAGKVLSERERFLLHYHVIELCREIRKASLTSNHEVGYCKSDDNLDCSQYGETIATGDKQTDASRG